MALTPEQAKALAEKLTKLGEQLMYVIQNHHRDGYKPIDYLRGCEHKQYVFTEIYEVAKALGVRNTSGKVESEVIAALESVG